MPLYTVNDFIRLDGAAGVSSSEIGRTPSRKDYARLLHAPSFRRLQGKTQLFPGSESDFFRNRLTHSLEVAQIASGIAERINAEKKDFINENIDRDLVQFAALAHDLGHPPFGHNGEKALDQIMKPYGGFEGNAQTLRILAVTEKKLVKNNEDWVDTFGLNLTYRALAAILKYDHPIQEKRPKSDVLRKGYYFTESDIVKKIKRNVAAGFQGKKFKTIECYIMDLADDIAYSTYDLEDSFHAGFVTPVSLFSALFNNDAVRNQVLKKTNKALRESLYKPLKNERELIENAIRIFRDDNFSGVLEQYGDATQLFGQVASEVKSYELDQQMSKNSLLRTQFTATRVGTLIAAVDVVYNKELPCLSTVRLNRDALVSVEILKHLNYELVIKSSRLAVAEHRGKDIVTHIFNAIIDSGGKLLPEDWKEEYVATKSSKASKYRTVCDFVSSMTDNYAIEFHDALFGDGKSLYKPV